MLACLTLLLLAVRDMQGDPSGIPQGLQNMGSVGGI